MFEETAARFMPRLIADLDISAIAAAAVIGNIGHECNGFRTLREIGQKGINGGFGWAQWTGVRREQFFLFCKKRKTTYLDEESNYAFLIFELKTTERKSIKIIANETDIVRAVQLFERSFERAGVINLRSRVNYAKAALKIYRNSHNNV